MLLKHDGSLIPVDLTHFEIYLLKLNDYKYIKFHSLHLPNQVNNNQI